MGPFLWIGRTWSPFYKEKDTMKLQHVLALAVVAVLVTGIAFAEKAEKAIKSGPQVGEDLAGPFQPLNVTGSAAGKKNCRTARTAPRQWQ
jgi:hypothetical protein